MAKTKRICAGYYEMTGSFKGRERIVTISYHEHLKGWIAAAQWDRCLYTDVLATKAQAVFNAELMIKGE